MEEANRKEQELAVEDLSFEEALQELEKIVSGLQRSDLTLDHSLALFQRGSYLAGVCRKKLDQAEQEVKVLLQDQQGTAVEQDFHPAEERESL